MAKEGKSTSSKVATAEPAVRARKLLHYPERHTDETRSVIGEAIGAARGNSHRPGALPGRLREVPEKFLVALSFSGEKREFVRAIAAALEHRLGPSRVFLDEWFEHYIAGHDADLKLQHIYGSGCELVVLCVSATYGSKAWTRVEHEAIRARLMQARTDEDSRQQDRIFPIRVGDGDVAWMPVNAIAPDVRGRTPEQVAELIVDRLQFVMGPAVPDAAEDTSVSADPENGKASVPEYESAANSLMRRGRQLEAQQPIAPQRNSSRAPPRVRCQIRRLGAVAPVIALMLIAIAPIAVAAIVWQRDVMRRDRTERVPPSLVPSPGRSSVDVGAPLPVPVKQDEEPAPVTKTANDACDRGASVRAPGPQPVRKLAPASRVPHRSAPEQRAPSRPFRQPPATKDPRYTLAARRSATAPELPSDEIGKRRVRRTVLDNVDQLRRCYEDQLQVEPLLEGKLQLTFVISGTGSVLSSNATGLGDAVDYCVAGEIASMSFSPRPDGSGVVVNYPLFFRLAQLPNTARKSPMLDLGVPTVLQPRIRRPGT